MNTFIKLAAIILLVSCNIKKNSDDSKFFFQTGESYFQQHRYNEAVAHYWQVIHLLPDTDTLVLKSYFQLFFSYYKLADTVMLDSTHDRIAALYPRYIDEFRPKYFRAFSYYLYSKRQYQESLNLLRKAISSQQQPLLNDYFRMGVIYYQMNMIDSALYFFRLAIKEGHVRKDSSNFILASAYCNLANHTYYYQGDMDRAKLLFDSMQWVMSNSSNPDSDQYAWNLDALGVFLQTKGYINRAKELFEKAYNIYTRLPGDHEFEKATILISQATIDYYMQKNTIALSKIDQAIQCFREKHEPYYLVIAQTVRANILFGINEYRRALQEYFSLLQQYDSVQLLRKETLYYLIGRCYMKINHLDSANYWLQRSIKHLTNPSPLLVNYCCTYADFLMNAGKPQQALTVLEHQYPYVKKKFEGKNQQLIYFLTTRAKILEKLEKYKESLALYNQIFELITNKSYPTTSPYMLPQLENSDYELANEIIAAIEGKAELLSKIAGDNKDILLASLQHFQKAAELADTYKRSIRMEMDKLLYNEFNTQISEKIFALAVRLWNISESASLKDYYYQLAFNVSNSLKANVLTENIIENSLKQMAGIPDSIRSKEKAIMQDILYLQNTIHDEYRQANPNLSLIKSWQKQLVTCHANLQEIESRNETQYPLYRELKYQHRKIFTINELQEHLQTGENILSYHWQGNQIYLFLINKQTVKLFSNIDTTLTAKIEQFRENLTHPSLEKNYTRQFHEYVNLAFYLYQKLMEAAVPFFDGNKLIIIPDKQLNYIPFEALLCDTNRQSNLPDYGLLSYLIYRYNIRYAYSIHLYDFQQKNFSPASKGVIAFAPTYKQSSTTTTSRSALYRSQLAPLPGAAEEAREIVKIIGGRTFKGAYATESQFKKCAQQGYILHLAMHTLVDDANPMYSKLAFAGEKDSVNDGLLNAFEIYGLRFSTPLVVLSACNTGYGKMLQGEGLYSLTRGFIYGGCPSLLFTLWQISDKPSKNLMQFFYHHIKHGENIDLALRNAKIQYLHSASASMAHPYFWAAYCLTGKNESIHFLKGYHRTIWLISLALMFVFIIILLYSYRNLLSKY